MEDLRQEIRALRARMRLQVLASAGALAIVAFALGGAEAVADALVAADAWKIRTNNASAILTDRLAVSGDEDVATVDVRDANLRLSPLGTGAGQAYGGRAIDFAGTFNDLDRSVRVENRAAGPTTDGHRLAFVDQATGAEMMSLLRGGNLGVGTTAPLGRAEFRQDGGLALVTINNAVAGPDALAGLLMNEGGGLGGAVWHNNSGPNALPGGPNAVNIYNFTAAPMTFATAGVERMRIDAAGNVGINTTTPTATFDVNGTVSASVKAFNIAHPTQAGKRLIHACIEGPESAVYYRGEAVLCGGSAEVVLPEYFEALTAAAGRTVQLTCKDGWSPIWSTTIANGRFTVKTNSQGNSSQAFYWEVKAVRKDIAPLVTELTKPAEETAAKQLKTEVEKLKK